MYNVHLTHSLLCFEFVELTLRLYKYFYDEYGESYGRAFFDNRKADIENNVEKDAYLESKVLNRILIEYESSILRVYVNNLLNEMVAYVDTHRLNREEAPLSYSA